MEYIVWTNGVKIKMSNNKRIAKNIAFLYIRQLIVMVVSIYTSRVILDVLGASDYGVYNVVGGIVTMMSFLNGALGSSSSRFLTYELGKGNQDKLNSTFSASLNLHICVALIVLIVGETLGLWFFYEKLVIPADRVNAAFWVYQFSIITTMVNFTQVPYNASLIAHENMSIYAYVGLYEAVSKLIIVYLLMVSPIDKLIFYGLLLMLNTVGIQLFYRYYTSKRYQECHFRLVKEKPLYKTLLGYSGWDLFGGAAVICQNQGLNILLNMFFGPVLNAARAISFQIQGALLMFINNIFAAVRPQVGKSYASNEYKRMYQLTFVSSKFAFILMLALMLPICFELKFILSIWLGKNVPEETYIFTLIILVTNLLDIFHNSFLMPLHAVGRIKTANFTGGFLMILTLPISYVCLKWGMPSYTVFIVLLVINPSMVFIGWYLLNSYVPFSFKHMFKVTYIPSFVIVVIAICPPFIITHILEEGWGRLFVVIIATETIILLSTYYIAIDKEMQKMILKIIKHKILKL